MNHTLVKKILLLFSLTLIVFTCYASQGSAGVSSPKVHLFHTGNVRDYDTVQDAVYEAVDGDTVNIDPGTFVEQVSITKNITLHGAGTDQTIIQSPSRNELAQSGGDWKNLKNQDVYAVIGIKTDSDSGEVLIKDLTVDGNDQGYLPESTYDVNHRMDFDFVGIGAYNTNVTIDSVRVTGVRELASDYGMSTPSGYLPSDQPAGANHNEGIFAESAQGTAAHTLTVKNSTIDKFQKTAILAWGPTLEVNIHDNLIQGYGQTLYSTGNGIQVGSSDRSGQGGANGDRRGTTGIIRDNNILGIGVVIPPEGEEGSYLNLGLSGPSGILLYYAGDGVQIEGNTITRHPYTSWHNDGTSDDGGFSNMGIDIYEDSNAIVEDNVVSGFDYGILEESSSAGSHLRASGNKLTNNAIAFWSGQGNDEITLGQDAEVIAFNQSGNGVDTLTNFGTGDAINVIGFATNSVNGYVYGQPVVDFTGGAVTSGDGTNVAAKSVQVFTSGNTTKLYIDTDGNSGVPELEVNLRGIFKPENFELGDGFIRFVAVVPDAPTNVTASAGNGQATISFSPPLYSGGIPITSYEVISNPGGITATGNGSPITVTGLSNGTSYTFTVKAKNAVGESAESVPSNQVAPHSSSSGGGSTQNSTPSQNNQVDVLVNNKAENAGTLTTSNIDGKTVATITVDERRIEQKLESEGVNSVITIPVNAKADIIVGQINGQMIKNMENKEAVLEVKTDRATYTLPAQQINIDEISKELGNNITLKDVNVQVEISKPNEDTVKVIQNVAKANELTIVVPPVEFNVKCSYAGKTVEVNTFSAYVERTIPIPDGIDPSKITTGVILDVDGTIRHVPTKVVAINGKYFAKINSLTNSAYSVIWHPIEFSDVSNHWAKDSVNDMGSRMVISGVGNGNFEPERNITRAEFATIIVRALGLKPGTGKNNFTDVNPSDWYCQYVETAFDRGIINGYGDNKFGPTDMITREQAMTMIAKAMKITGLKVDLKIDESDNLLKQYLDSGDSSEWAKTSIANCIKTGIVTGKSGTMIAPKDDISRAEVAVIVKRLLQKSRLI
ncbi:S-layer homology domain-containing protein [Heliobacterium chlorum]|uniref:S-layer homology domain-containing protein n=1 Tax=Heliobacterium chlorum TaxID=2698 RepID=A0ABR7T6A9_HELCL|nr:S-layer homology domain-containing protein [Heliobacterium chlorum]MBC9785379.1 S-layer homology domain-containing protein [Heliobacterium chlorum]